jgi:hypothetical protein
MTSRAQEAVRESIGDEPVALTGGTKRRSDGGPRRKSGRNWLQSRNSRDPSVGMARTHPAHHPLDKTEAERGCELGDN